MPGTCVILEQRGGEVKRASMETLAEALRLKPGMGGEVTAVLVGHDLQVASENLKNTGADRIFLYDRSDLELYSCEGYRNCAVDAVHNSGAARVLLAATIQGRDLGPAIAGTLDCGYAAECTAIEESNGALVATRPIFAGKAIIKVRCKEDPFVLSLRPNIFSADLPSGGPAEVVTATPPFEDGSLAAQVTSVATSEAQRKEIAEADIVVSGGRGTGGPEGFAPIEALADALDAAVGASRAVVDLGWRPHAEQVGQTGKVVSPKLYVAAGISGAIQHLAGMRTSKVIVAVNKDAEAPIFKVADYGIVGDLHSVLPALTEAVKALD